MKHKIMRGLFRIIQTIHRGTPQYGLFDSYGRVLGTCYLHYVSTVHHAPYSPPTHVRYVGTIGTFMLIIHCSGCILRNTSTNRLTAHQQKGPGPFPLQVPYVLTCLGLNKVFGLRICCPASLAFSPIAAAEYFTPSIQGLSRIDYFCS